jgi:thiol-disulfide isomerase/thioredoxin
MKKYFPIALFSIAFTAILLVQVLFDFSSPSARLSSAEKKIHSHYETVFKELELKSMKKKTFDLKKLKSPIVIVNFWASWCTPCLEEFPSLVELRKKFKDDELTILALNSDTKEMRKDVLKIIKKYKFNFPVIEDPEGKIFEKFMINEVPITIIYHNGKVMEVIKGGKDFNSVETIEGFNQKLGKK